MKKSGNIPVYSLPSFSSKERQSQQFQVEVFNANRHFAVKYPHRHDFYEVLYLSRGSGYHVIDGNKYEIKPPCVFFLSPGQAHKIEFSQDIHGFIFIFTPEFYLIDYNNPNRLIEFPFFFTIKQNNPPLEILANEDVQFIENLFKRGIEESKKQSDFSIEMLRSILDLILNFCALRYSTIEQVMSGTGHIIVKKFLQLLEENFEKNLSVAQFADMMALTPNHLTQTVSRLTGKTSSQIIRAKQIIEIKRLMVHTNLSITEIATKMNFQDQSYFAKFFKRETGLSPLQFRGRTV